MPRWLTLLRHGESQANLIQRASKKGLITEYPEAFLRTPDREIRLSRRGREQAELTGKWMAKEYPHGFDVILVSNHVRAMETAAIVCKAAGWTKTAMRLDPLLGERNWGAFSQAAPERRGELMELRERDPLHMPMPDGETTLMTRLRSRTLLERASREYSGKTMLGVTHGEYVESAWAEIAHLSTEEQRELFSSERGNLRNCQVIEFSAEDPTTLAWDGKLRWVRSSCPQANRLGDWGPIERKTFTAAQLLERVEGYPRLDLDSFGDAA